MPGGLRGPAAGAWLGVAWGPLSPAAVSGSPSVLPSTDAVSVLVIPKVHTPAAGVVPSMEPRNCCLATGVASWRVSQGRFSETRADGPVVPMTFLAASTGIPALSVSTLGLSAWVVVLSLLSLLTIALFVIELLVPHIQTPSVVLDTPLVFEVGLSGTGTVALTEASTQMPVPAAAVPVVPGVCLPLAEAVAVLAPGVGATLSHSVPCPSVVWVGPGVHLLAAGDAVPKDVGVSTPVAAVAVGKVLEGPV